MLEKKYAKIARQSALGGGLFFILLNIPFIGPFTVGFLLPPMCSVVPKEFCKTGLHVTFGFAWIEFHTFTAVLLYWAYYSLLVFIILVFLAAWKSFITENEISRKSLISDQKLQELISELQNGNDRQRRASSYKLSKYKDPVVVPALIRAYSDTDASVRRNASDGLCAIGTQDALDFLNSQKENISESVLERKHK